MFPEYPSSLGEFDGEEAQVENTCAIGGLQQGFLQPPGAECIL